MHGADGHIGRRRGGGSERFTARRSTDCPRAERRADRARACARARLGRALPEGRRRVRRGEEVAPRALLQGRDHRGGPRSRRDRRDARARRAVDASLEQADVTRRARGASRAISKARSSASASRSSFRPDTGYTDVLGTSCPGRQRSARASSEADTIVSIDGTVFTGAEQREVIAKIRGKAGESLRLVVLRGDALRTVDVKREVVALQVASHLNLPGNVGYLRIRSFNEKTPAPSAPRSTSSPSRGRRRSSSTSAKTPAARSIKPWRPRARSCRRACRW